MKKKDWTVWLSLLPKGKFRGQQGQLGSIIVVLLIGFIIIIGGTIFYGDILSLNSVTGVSYANDSTGANVAYAKINGSTKVIADSIRQSNSQGGNFLLVLFSGSINAVLQSFTILDAVKDLLGSTGEYLGLNGIDSTWFIGILIAIIVFIFAWRMLEVGLSRPV